MSALDITKETYAFPWVSPGHNAICPGMTLRDWFAGLAMQAIFAGSGAHDVANCDDRYDETNWSKVVALNAFEMADAMLAERNKP